MSLPVLTWSGKRQLDFRFCISWLVLALNVHWALPTYAHLQLLLVQFNKMRPAGFGKRQHSSLVVFRGNIPWDSEVFWPAR